MIEVLLTIALFLFLINARPAYAFATLVQQSNFGCSCNSVSGSPPTLRMFLSFSPAL